MQSVLSLLKQVTMKQEESPIWGFSLSSKTSLTGWDTASGGGQFTMLSMHRGNTLIRTMEVLKERPVSQSNGKELIFSLTDSFTEQ